MLKHRGFPGRLRGTDFQFTVRRPGKEGATPLGQRARHADRRPADRAADRGFMDALWEAFGEEPFMRGNLDAGRLNWLLGREVVPADSEAFDPASYETWLRIDPDAVRRSFPGVIEDA